MTKREKIIFDMAKAMLKLQPDMPEGVIFMPTRTAALFADAALSVAERALAEKHARIAAAELLRMKSKRALARAVYHAIRMSVPANLVASVERKETGDD